MSASDKEELLQLLEELERRKKTRRIDMMYPEKGRLQRELYAKHMQFFAAGKEYRERCMLAANRVGKSYGAGGYEVALHLTGQYPTWWNGRRFNHAVDWWAAGESSKTARDTIQKILLGEHNHHGTGLIPADCIVRTTPKPGIADGIEDIYVKHVSGGISHIGLKSYEQGAGSFMGTAKHGIWLDEEPPLDIYSECLLRTMIVDGEGMYDKTSGMMLSTFTPLNGLSEVVMHFLPDGKLPDGESERFVIQVTWDEVPHLTKEMKESLWASLPPHERDARSKGRPQLGSGAIYPFSEEDVVIEPIKIPTYWPRVYGMDVGWNRTAVVWGAWDRETDCLYLYSEHYLGKELVPVHVNAIQSRGRWIPGVIDPASNYGSTKDGEQLLSDYREGGLILYPANNSVEAGIERVRLRLATGRLKVFTTLRNWLAEFRVYRRDKNGKIVKKDDHAMDATRYLEMSGLQYAITEPRYDDDYDSLQREESGKSRVGGY